VTSASYNLGVYGLKFWLYLRPNARYWEHWPTAVQSSTPILVRKFSQLCQNCRHGVRFDWVRLNVPPNTLQVISGTGFYRSNDPTSSVKALNEDKSKGLGFSPIRSTPPCSQWYNNYAVYETKKQKYTQTQINLRTLKWTQWDKTVVWGLNAHQSTSMP